MSTPALPTFRGEPRSALLFDAASHREALSERFARSQPDLATLMRVLGAPLLVKPRTQVLLETRSKGVRARNVDEAAAAWQRFYTNNHHGAALLERYPGVDRPMLQAFHERAAESIYVLAGFCDRRFERAPRSAR